MSRDLKVKILVIISLVIMIFFALVYRSDYLIFGISLIASLIEIIVFMAWYFEDSAVLQRVDVNLEEVKEAITKKETKNIYREKIIRKIINKGKIDQEELKSILAKIEKHGLVLISLSECRLPKTLTRNVESQNPLRNILQMMGFTPLFWTRYGNSKIWIIPKDDLHKRLRNLGILKKFIIKELQNTWKETQVNANKFPNRFEKWKTGRGFKVSLIISKSSEHEFKVGYLGNHSFSKEFVTKLLNEGSKDELNKAISDKVEVRKMLSKLSIELFLGDVNLETRDILLQNEKRIKENLNIKSFLDYRSIDEDKIVNELDKYLKNGNVKKVSSIIRREAVNYYNEMDEMGLLID